MERPASDQELDAWEMVSSSEEGGSECGEAAATEAAALAASFLAAEPLSPLAASRADVQGGSADGEEPVLPGSPESAQLLQLMAAEAPAAPSLAAASEEGEGEAMLPPAPAGLGDTSSSGIGGMSGASPSATDAMLAPEAAAPAAPSTPLVSGGCAASAAMRRAASLRLRVVRSDEQESLERAVAELEKRASQRERELALARQRLSSAQAKLAEESHEAHRLRKIAMIACSICAFLGLKALMGGPHRAASCGGLAAACAPPAAAPPRVPCVAHSVHEPAVGLLQPKVAIEVEALAAAAP